MGKKKPEIILGNRDAMERPRQEEPHSVVSYFCGCGGLDLGFRGGFHYRGKTYERLPFDIKLAFDNNKQCVETYNKFFGEGRAHVKDVRELHVEELPSAEVLIGGFPCQEFSSCGPQGGLKAERGRLYQTLITYMMHHHPKMVVGENVINLERMENGAVIEKIKQDLTDAGYKVEVWKMYAPDYGVPQTRSRLIFICVRKDLWEKYGMPTMPEATFKDNPRSLAWAIDDLKTVSDSSVPNQDQFFKAARAKNGNGQGDEVSKKDAPSYTIRANPRSRIQYHYELDRRLTVRECARIQTFPDDFEFPFSPTVNISQIGNAVPPVLAHCVAESVSKHLNKIKSND